MSWQIVVLSRVIFGHVFGPIFLKKIADLPATKQRLCWQFGYCLLFSIIYTSFVGFQYHSALWIVVTIGFFNSFGAYCQWRAINISLSKTALFTQADDLIAILLGWYVLNEIKLLGNGLLIGVMVCFAAVSLIASYEKNWRLIKYVAAYSVIWGAAGFLFRYFAIKGIPFSSFLVSWYGGTLLGAICIYVLSHERFPAIKLTKKEVTNVGLLAIVIWLSLFLSYWSAKLAPVTVYQPIFMITEAIFPALIGLYIFKEKGRLTSREKIAFLIGLTGVAIIALYY